MVFADILEKEAKRRNTFLLYASVDVKVVYLHCLHKWP